VKNPPSRDRKNVSSNHLPVAPWGWLPPELQVLYIRGRVGPAGWLASALAGESACRVEVTEVDQCAAGLERLRSEAFDAVVVDRQVDVAEPRSLIDAIRAGSHPHQPVLVLGEDFDSEQAACCLEAGADAYLAVRWTTARELLWHLSRAAERRRLIDENQRLQRREKRQRDREREEAFKLLAEQSELVQRGTAPLETAGETGGDWLQQELGDLLHTYVLMGSGHLTDELVRLALRLEQAAVPASVVLRTYLQVLQNLLVDLGSRSSRHVLNRGHVLLLQILLVTTPGSNHEGFRYRPDLQRGREHPTAVRTAR
jgi:DNA-binding NarL/FixJ family response regulator